MRRLQWLALAFTAILAIATVVPVRAQNAPAVFEVASVKSSNPNTGSSPLGAMPMGGPSGAGRFSGSNYTLRMLLIMAYELQDFQIIGGPSWQTADRFDINAKAENPNTTFPQMRPMFRALLADRFKLKVHTEKRDMPIYALVLSRSDGKLGPNIKASTADCGDLEAQQQKLLDIVSKGGANAQQQMMDYMNGPCGQGPWLDAPGGFGMKFSGQPITTLTMLLTQATGRMVEDQTGLKGNFDYKLAMDPQFLMRMMSQLGMSLPANVTLPGSDNPAILTAIQEQLGVKVESRRGPVDVLVIDSAEKPTPD